MNGALLATRFYSLEAFRAVVQVDYLGDTTLPDSMGSHTVRLCHCSAHFQIESILTSGPSQQDLQNAKDGNWLDKVKLIRDAPAVMAHRADLERVFLLARHFQSKFGEGDPAFFDLADSSLAHIDREDLLAVNPADTSEKGFINTFNHVTAQAFITSIFSEDLADLAADLHERKNMSTLVTGRFTQEQLSNPDNNPVDNYVDMINNEWGQELGKFLKAKYHIHPETHWTPTLLADYLNDLQSFYSWAFLIPIRPFRPQDEVLWRFANKINMVMGRKYG